MGETNTVSNVDYVSAYIGLGANLSQPVQQIKHALQNLHELPSSKLIKASSLYLSRPMGPQDQEDYVNAVALLHTQLQPIELLDELQKIENNFGRVRNAQRWGPRILDLDIILYNHSQITQPRLTVPHYGMRERNFVIIPLYEIAPELLLPDNTPLVQLFENIDKHGIQKL